MKKITLLLTALFFSVGMFAQCPEGADGQWPTGTIPVVNDGAINIIEGCNYSTEFSVLDGFTIGEDYQFSIMANADGINEYVTVVDSADGTTVLGHGDSPFTWTATVTGVQLNWSIDGTCVGDDDCHTTTYVNVTLAPPPPSNDTCATPLPIDCNDTLSGDTSAFGVTNTAGNLSNDLWYVYSGVAGDITASLCTSAYDTNILVYSECGGDLIGSNDDSCDVQSLVTFTADGSSSYYIAVEGYDNNNGIFDIAITCEDPISPPANNDCINAEMLTFGISAMGTTAGATEELVHEKAPCDPFGTMADVWYTIDIPPGRSDLTINTDVIAPANQAFISLYRNCDALRDDSIECSDNGGNESITAFDLISGTYYIRIWSDGLTSRSSQRIEGEFNIVVDATLSTTDFESDLGFSYYPNPVNDNLTLFAQKNIENVSVYNLLGQEVLRATPNAINTDVNMSELQSGAYFVKVSINGNTETVKIIKE